MLYPLCCVKIHCNCNEFLHDNMGFIVKCVCDRPTQHFRCLNLLPIVSCHTGSAQDEALLWNCCHWNTNPHMSLFLLFDHLQYDRTCVFTEQVELTTMAKITRKSNWNCFCKVVHKSDTNFFLFLQWFLEMYQRYPVSTIYIMHSSDNAFCWLNQNWRRRLQSIARAATMCRSDNVSAVCHNEVNAGERDELYFLMLSRTVFFQKSPSDHGALSYTVHRHANIG